MLGRCSGTRRREGASRRRELGLRVPGDVHDADLAGGADSSDVAALDGVWGDAALRRAAGRGARVRHGAGVRGLLPFFGAGRARGFFDAAPGHASARPRHASRLRLGAL